MDPPTSPVAAARRRLDALTVARLLSVYLPVVGSSVARRVVYGPRQPSWSLPLELFVDVIQHGGRQPDVSVKMIRKTIPPGTPPIPGTTVDKITVAGCKAEWVVHESARSSPRVILYLHGGGYCVLSPPTYRAITSRLSRQAVARVLSLDYRLAPENPFPAALDDATAAFLWLVAPDGGNTPPSNIVIMGDSAGGGLTMATLLNLRDRQHPLPACAVGLSPWVDLMVSSASWYDNATSDYLPRPTSGALDMPLFYAGSVANLSNPLVSPIFGDLTGLPPLLIQVGGAETLRDEGAVFADKARSAGVDAELEVYPEMVHVFQMLPSILVSGNAARAHAAIARFVAKHIPGPPIPASAARSKSGVAHGAPIPTAARARL